MSVATRLATAWRIASGRPALSADIQEVLVGAIARLPADQRAVIELRDLKGRGADDVCTTLDLSDARQRVLLHRGRITLRAALAAALEPRAV